MTRWGGALPQYAVGHVERIARVEAAVASVPGLAVCGASYAGIGIPACIASAQQSGRRDNGCMVDGKTARELNDTIRYTAWSVFRVADPIGD